MTNRKDILRAHYAELLRRAATWVGLGSILVMSLAAGPVSAAQPGAQITVRSLTLGSSAASASTTYSFGFKPATAATIKAIKLEQCTSPLEMVACVRPDSATFGSATIQSMGGELVAAGWAPTNATNTSTLKKAAGDALTSGTAQTVVMAAVGNPTVANKSFYVRITLYNDNTTQDPSTETDFGAVAVSTARQITTSANVQESLTFCVGTSGTDCSGGGLTGTSVNLGTGTENVLSASAPSGGTSLMYADTNATTGYSITYLADNLKSTNDTITEFGGTAGTFVAGTAKFGINLKDNATPDIGAGKSGSGSGAVGAQYDIADNFAFVHSTTTPAAVASAAGPTLGNLYTVSYAAQAGSTSKPGAYSTTFTWVCTGTF